MMLVVSPRKSECSVGIEIQPPPGRRPDGAREVEPNQAVDEARAHTHAGERPGERQPLARTRASDVGEKHDAGGRPAIRQLEARAPKGVAARRVPTVAAHGARPAEVP